MHINSNAPTAVTQKDPRQTKRVEGSSTATDRVRTSSKAQMLSRNIEILREQLLPRDAILKKFSGIMDQPLKLDNSSIDRILNHL